MQSHSYYKEFNEDQFAADEYFQHWVLSPDSKANDFWQYYLNLNAGQAYTISKARQLVKGLAEDDFTIEPLSIEEKAALKKTIYQRLQLSEQTDTVVRVSTNRFSGLLAAAAVLAVAMISTFILLKPAKVVAEAPALFTTVISDKETREIILPDSSVVILNAGSYIKYKNNFFEQADREVFLTGNAFFKITKHPEHKQFIVHAKTLDITVIGTQFNVNARTEAADIGLTSGKVKVTRPNITGAAYMAPGEKISLDTAGHVLIKTKLDTKLYSAWTEKKWKFQQTELQDITELIREYYGATAEFKNEKYRRLKITAVIPVTTLESLAFILSKTLHIEINQTGDQLIIQ